MITKFNCENCGNNDPLCTRFYDGALGYEAIYCTCCGAYYDHSGFHLPDQSSFQFISKPKQKKLTPMYVDVKVLAWKRLELPESVTKEQVIKLLQKGNSNNGFNELLHSINPESILLDITAERRSNRVVDPIDDRDSSTVELFANKFEDPIWTNKTEYPDKIRLEWSVDDFEYQAQQLEGVDLDNDEEYDEENPMLYDRSKFPYALSIMKRRHDCNYGVSWDTIEAFLNEHCKL